MACAVRRGELMASLLKGTVRSYNGLNGTADVEIVGSHGQYLTVPVATHLNGRRGQQTANVARFCRSTNTTRATPCWWPPMTTCSGWAAGPLADHDHSGDSGDGGQLNPSRRPARLRKRGGRADHRLRHMVAGSRSSRWAVRVDLGTNRPPSAWDGDSARTDSGRASIDLISRLWYEHSRHQSSVGAALTHQGRRVAGRVGEH